MFCTITFEKTKKKFRKNIRIENKSVGSVEYLKVTCFNKINTKKLEKKLSKTTDKIVLSDNIKDISFNKIEIYDNTDFLKNIAVLTFKNIINMTKIPTNKLSLSVTDKKARFTDFVYSLSKKASVIKVSTESLSEYETECKYIYEDFGMQPIISENVLEADLGIDLDKTNPIIWFNTPENYVEITKECVKLGAGLKSYVPKGISECEFAGLLKDYRDFKRLNLITAELMKKNGKFYKINHENIKNFLDNEINY